MKNQIKESNQNASDRNTIYLPDALPKMIKREMFLTYKSSGYQAGISGYESGILEIRDFDYCGDDRVIIAKQSVTFNISAKLDRELLAV